MTNKALIPLYKEAGGKHVFVGSGFFISETLLATAWHVVRDEGKFLLFDGQYIELRLVFKSYFDSRPNVHGPESDDLAIYSLPEGINTQYYLPLAHVAPSNGAPCYALGFLPTDGEPNRIAPQHLECSMWYEGSKSPSNAQNIIFLEGWAQSLHQGELYGMSGGPVINEAEEVVGLFFSGGLKRIPRVPSPDYASTPNVELFAISSIHIIEAMNETLSSISKIGIDRHIATIGNL